MKPVNYILIAGLPRSGSTLMQAIINQSPQTYTLPETHYYEELQKLGITSDLTPAQSVAVLKIIRQRWDLKLCGLLREIERVESIHPDKNYDSHELFFRIIELFRPENSEALIGVEKTPGHLFSIDRLLKCRTDIKVILTRRNPRDFANSMIRQNWAPDSFEKILQMWCRYLACMGDLEKSYPDRVTIVDYEEMVNQPTHTFRQVFEHVGIEWDSEYLHNLNISTEGFITNRELDWKGNNLNLPSVNPATSDCKLTILQRLNVHRKTLFSAFKFGCMRHYRI